MRPPARSLPLLSLLALAPAGPLAAEAAAPLDPRAVRLREEGLALVAQDDAASLSRAEELLAEAARAEPRLFAARADRAMVRSLAAAGRREEAARTPGAEELVRSARELRERALDDLRPVARDHPKDPAVLRALAVYYGLDGRIPETERLAAEARAASAGGPWIHFAELAAWVRAAGPRAALPQLEAFAAAHPELLRVRWMAALRLQDLSRAEESLAAVEELLERNPAYDRAKRLKARLLAPPPARVELVPVPVWTPPPRPPGLLPRKPPPGR